MDITPQIHRYLTTAPASHFLQREVQMRDHWTGRDNLLWRVACGGQEAAVKLFLDAGQARGRRQYDGQERFAPLGIAPRPLWFDRYPEGLSRQVLAYSWVPGEPLKLAVAGQRIALAHTVAQVHCGDPSTVRRFCPNPINLDYWWRVLRGSLAPIQAWLAQQAADALLVTFEQLASRASTLVKTALPHWSNASPAPVHGDLRQENVINSFETGVLLDWELFGLGDPALDVASLLQHSQAELDESGREEWLDAYLAHFDQPGLAERIGVYQRLLPFQAVCFLLGGLRDHLHSPDSPVLAGQFAFFSSTVDAALRQAGQAFQLEISDMNQALEPLFRERTT